MTTAKHEMGSLSSLSKYQFDTSTYSILKDGSRRASGTGRLVSHQESQTQPKASSDTSRHKKK